MQCRIHVVGKQNLFEITKSRKLSLFARASFERPLRAHTKLKHRKFSHGGILYIV